MISLFLEMLWNFLFSLCVYSSKKASSTEGHIHLFRDLCIQYVLYINCVCARHSGGHLEVESD